MRNEERLKYISGIKSIAFLMVIITHFLAAECSEVFKYWTAGSYDVGWILAPIKGKIGVSIFCVASGFLAAHTANAKKSDIGDSIIRRYIKFSFNILVINAIYLISQKVYLHFNLPTYYTNQLSAYFCMADGVCLLGNVNPPLWVIRDLFVGYVACLTISYYFKCYKYRYLIYIATVLVLFLCNMVWLFTMGLGMLLNCMMKDDSKFVRKLHGISKNRMVIIAKFVVAYLLYIRSEGVACAHVGYGIASFLLLWGILDSEIAKRIFSNKFLVFIDNYSFEMYLLHIWLLYFLAPLIKTAIPGMPVAVLFLIYMIVLVAVVVNYKQLVSIKIDTISKRIVQNRTSCKTNKSSSGGGVLLTNTIFEHLSANCELGNYCVFPANFVCIYSLKVC